MNRDELEQFIASNSDKSEEEEKELLEQFLKDINIKSNQNKDKIMNELFGQDNDEKGTKI
jgi:hypothetical protein